MKAVKKHLSIIGKSFSLTFLLLAFITSAIAQGNLNVSEQVSLVKEFEVNGLKVIVKRRSNTPTVAAALYVKGGVRNITKNTAGIEAYTLDAATEGSKNYSRDTVRREFAATGSQIGASVSNDFSFIAFASTLQNFDKTWDIFADLTMNPTFEKESVERLRERYLTSLKEQESDNDNYLDVLQNRIVYKEHPYENSVSGTVETIQKFTQKDLRDYHKKIMQTSQLLLVVVGDIDAEKLKEKVTATLGKLPKGNYKEKPLPKITFSKGTVDVTERNVPTNYVRGVFDAPSIDNPDYFAMRVTTTILGSLFFQEVRERRQLTYAADADLDSLQANSASIYVTTTDANQSISVMLDLIKTVKSRQLRPDVIKQIAGFFLTNYYIKNETNAAQVNELAKYELIGGGWRNSFEFLNGVQNVKPQDIQRVSQKYIKNIRFIVIGNPKQIDKSIFLPAVE